MKCCGIVATSVSRTSEASQTMNWLNVLSLIQAFLKVVLKESNIIYTSFDASDRQTGNLLKLVHSDVCGKISETLIGGAQYFLTFTDNKSRYLWVYILKTKDQVFEHFVEWKS